MAETATPAETTQVSAEGAPVVEADPVDSISWDDFLVDNTPDEGSVEQVDTSTEAPFTPVTLTIDGQAVKVESLEDLEKGFLRQADYTRKTQEVAAARQQLAPIFQLVQALDEDPKAALTYLANQLGVDLTSQEVVEEGPLTQFDQRLAAVEQERALANARQEIVSELNGQASQYGEFDQDALIQYAVEHKIASLPLAYHTMVGERYSQEQTLARKKQAQIVEPGGATAADAVTPGQPGKKLSLAESLRLAVQQ